MVAPKCIAIATDVIRDLRVDDSNGSMVLISGDHSILSYHKPHIQKRLRGIKKTGRISADERFENVLRKRTRTNESYF